MRRGIGAAAGILLAAAVFTAGLEGLSVILYPSNTITRNWESFYAQPENSIDMLFVGSSHAYSSFDPAVFEEVTGRHAYILASNSQNMTQSYYNVMEALHYQSPEVIVLEAFGISNTDNWQEHNEGTFDRDWKKESNIDGMRLGLTKVRAVFAQYTRANRPYALLRILRAHTGWKDPETVRDNMEFLGGGAAEYEPFHPSETVMSEETKAKYAEKKKSKKAFEISDVNRENFFDLAGLCRDRGIRLVLVMAPLYEGYTEKVNYASRHDQLAAMADEAGIPFIDCAEAYEEMGLSADDFEDAYNSYHHLNASGADKVSRYVAERLSVMEGRDL